MLMTAFTEGLLYSRHCLNPLHELSELILEIIPCMWVLLLSCICNYIKMQTLNTSLEAT